MSRGGPKPRPGGVRLQPDDAAARDIIRTDLTTNLLVEAGAGSGKTQMLAERMAAGVASGVYRVEEMAAVTFTRKAASELRGRFHLALEEILRRPDLQVGHVGSAQVVPGGGTDAEQARVRAALGNLERFFAGTIHSFCARLLRERPVESGVSPGFTELDELQDLELRQRVWRDFITNARASGDPDMLELLDAGVKPQDLDHAFGVICTHEDVEFPPGDGLAPDPEPAWKALEKFWNDLQKLLPAAIADDTTCNIQKKARDFEAKWRVAQHRARRPNVIAALMAHWDCDSKIVQKCWSNTAAGKARAKEAVDRLHGGFRAVVVQPWLAHWRQYIYRLSVSLLTRARAHAARERRRLNTLNYGDLLILAANVLRENAGVRRALQRKYRHLFVDEFQDTDPIQAEIIFLLGEQTPVSVGPTFRSGDAGSEMPTAPPDWRTIPVRPGALFVVGDPKQSIYRFRRADIEVYNEVRRRFEDPSVGRVVELTRNWRSVPALCEWANGVFEQQFPADPTPHAPKFAPLVPRDDAEDTGGPSGLFTLTHTGDAKSIPAEDAARIARYIRAEVDAGRRKYSDFLLLTRRKKDRIAPYAEALEQLDIPIEVSGAGSFGESPEVKALTVLLRALADPQDALSLVNVLRGPLFGISDPGLFAFKQSGGWLSIFGGLQAVTETVTVTVTVTPTETSDQRPATEVGAALAALARYHRWTRILPAAAALDRILEHTGYLALAATTPGGVEAGDLLHAVDRVRQVVEDGGSLSDAADALEEDAEAINEVESLPLEPGRSDVVRLMNLHKAKGLEAAIVFLADPTGGYKPKVDVHIRRAGGHPATGLVGQPFRAASSPRAQGWFKIEKRSDWSYARPLLGVHADWEQHEAAEQPYLDAEEDRLLYVAATRAREMLVVSRQVPPKGTPAWGVLNGFLDTAKQLPVPPTVRVGVPKPEPCTAKAQTEANAARANAEAAVNQPSWSITSVTAESKPVIRIPAAEPAAADDGTRVVAQNTPSHRADAGMAWGTLIHGLLEHAMRHPSSSRDDLRRLALWLTVEEPQLRAVIEEAIDTVETVAKADFWAEAQRHSPSEETPFAVAGSARLTTGVIDLLYETDAGWKVVDYKTDHSLAEGRYSAQLEAYRAALRAVGCVDAGARVVSVRAESA